MGNFLGAAGLTRVWNKIAATYLSLSGGTMTGTLRLNPGVSIEESSGNNGLLVYHPTDWTGVSSTQWAAGTVDSQGVIRSSNTDLLHYRNGTSYVIWDSANDGSGSGLDADTVDGLHGNRIFKKNLISASADCNTMEDNSFTILDQDANSLTCSNKPGDAAIDGGYGVLTVTHGSYKNQLFFPYTSTGDIFTRAKSYGGSGSPTWYSWYKIYHSGNCNKTDVDWTCNNLYAGGVNIRVTSGSPYWLGYESGGAYFWRNNIGYYMRLLDTGSVSICANTGGSVIVGGGTDATPYAKLEVAGSYSDPSSTDLGSSAMLAVNGHNDDGLFFGFNQSKGWIQSAYHGTSSVPASEHTYNLLLNPLGGNVGIGSIVESGVRLTIFTSDAYGIGLRRYGNNEISIKYENGTDCFVAGLWSSKFNIWRSGSGTLASFDASGNFTATGAVTAGSASDERLKENVQDLQLDFAKNFLMSIHPVTFTWNSLATSLYNQYCGSDIGLVAQEIEPYLPYAIKPIFEKYKRLEYHKLIPPIIRVVQDHEERIKNLEKTASTNDYIETGVKQPDEIVSTLNSIIKSYEAEIKELKERLEKLEKNDN